MIFLKNESLAEHHHRQSHVRHFSFAISGSSMNIHKHRDRDFKVLAIKSQSDRSTYFLNIFFFVI